MKSRRVKILAVVVVLFVNTSLVIAAVDFYDGQVHNINYEINNSVNVDWQAPGMGTTVNVLEGASIGSTRLLRGYEDSIINILGGSMGHLHASGNCRLTVSGGTINNYLLTYNSSQVNISGGSIDRNLIANDSSQVNVSGGTINDDFYAWDNSQVTFSGGTINNNLYARDSSQVTVSGGTMNGLSGRNSSQITVSGGKINYPLWANDSSQVNVSGGTMGAVIAASTGQATVSGGTIEGTVRASGSSLLTLSGGTIGGELTADYEGVLIISGSDFTIDGIDVGYIELTSILGLGYWKEPDRRLTGTLLSGDPLDSEFHIGDNAKIILIPEPATLALLSLGILIRRRRE